MTTRRDDASHARSAFRCDRDRVRSSSFRNCLRSPSDVLRFSPVFRGSARTHVVKKVRSPSAIFRRIRRPRVHACPASAALYSPPSRSASSDRPIVQPLALGSRARRKTPPRGAANHRRCPSRPATCRGLPRSERIIDFTPSHHPCRRAATPSRCRRRINRVAATKENGTRRDGALDHGQRQRRLVANSRTLSIISRGTCDLAMAPDRPSSSWQIQFAVDEGRPRGAT